jgi:hypothetical protein
MKFNKAKSYECCKCHKQFNGKPKHILHDYKRDKDGNRDLFNFKVLNYCSEKCFMKDSYYSKYPLVK